MKVYLVRHGAYENPRNINPGRLPVVLSEEGIAQVKAIKNKIAAIDIDIIYSSAVKRCQQTAEILAGDKIQIEYDSRLLEVLSPLQGRSLDVEAPYKDYFSIKSTLGGEDKKDVFNRIVDFWHEKIISQRDKYEHVVVVSHGDPLYMLYLYLIGDHEYYLADPTFPKNDFYPAFGSCRVVTIESSNKYKIAGCEV